MILLFSAGWYISNVHQNCDDACESHDLVCSEEELEAHHEDVDSSEEVISLLTDLGISLSATSCKNKETQISKGKGYANPVYGTKKNGKKFCTFVDDPSRKLATFNCAQVPLPLKENKQRICWCSKPSKKSNN